MKVRKKIGAIVIASILLIGTMQAVAYANTVSGTMAGAGYTASSSISTYSGSAYTTYGNSGSVSVSATYYFKDKTYGNPMGSYSNNSSGVSSASVSFSAPTGCVSQSISAYHTVSYQGQNWSGPTYDN